MNQRPIGRRAALAALLGGAAVVATGCIRRAYGRPVTFGSLVMRFELPDITGNPFDFAENDVLVELSGTGNHAAIVPAFFDGGTTWAVRFTPPASGTWHVRRVTRNGQTVAPQHLAPTEFVAKAPVPGFIRRDPQNPRFLAYTNGTPYYPIGCNAAWDSRGVTVEGFLSDMGRTGQNWSRVWMNSWDNKNLDWVPGEPLAPGVLSLAVAKRWDAIVAAATSANVPFQMVLQHHGQYSTQVNPNWDDNSWNTKNGGFLATPTEFFTNEKAKRLTKAKYRYILARWGYSPHILAWELFNEVQFTDAGRKKEYAAIAAWHREMATFLRAHDVHRHLITTSSDESITGLYDAVDYRQQHSYPSDLVATIRATGDTFAAGTSAPDTDPKQPVFLGEIGQSGDLYTDTGTALRQIIWSGIMSAAPGAAQYWAWDNVGKRGLINRWKPATDFLRVFRLPSRRAMKPVALAFTETNRAAGAISFGAGGGWQGAKQTRYVVEASGAVAGIGQLSPYLQGSNNRALLPFLEFVVSFGRPGTVAAHIGQVSKNGADVSVSVDGVRAAQKAFPASDTDTNIQTVLSVAVPVGTHTVRFDNTGTDWARIEKFVLSPYSAPVQAVAKADTESVTAWIYPSDPSVTGEPLTATVAVPNLDAGKYHVFWWNPDTGKIIATDTATVAPGKPLSVKTPPIAESIALFAAHERTGKYVL